MQVTRFLRRHLSYASVASLLAIAMMAGTSAYAAVMFSGKNIKDGSLTTRDVAKLAEADVSAAARRSLGVKGARGPVGVTGIPGDEGAQGLGGLTGTPAQNAYAWAFLDNNSLLRARLSDNDGDPGWNWHDYAANYGSGSGWADMNGSGYQSLVQLASASNDGLLKLQWDSDVMASAHLVFKHAGTVHSRIECRMRIWEDNGGMQTNEVTIGSPVVVSSNTSEDVVEISMVGAVNRSAGTHGVVTQCRDLDYSIQDVTYQNWRFYKGNLSAVSAKNWRT